MSETTLNESGLSTSEADPWTESGYSDWRQSVHGVRRAWMEMMGFSDEEIAAECVRCPPTDIDEELSQYSAMFAIQQRNG